MFLPNIEEQRKAFRQFYHSLPNIDNIFYLYFTGGLLFIVKHSLKYFPEEMNLVLIGSALEQNEKAVLADEFSQYPLFSLDVYTDDREIWDILLSENKRNFGWIDVDCLLLDKKLIYEVQRADTKAAITGICDKSKASLGNRCVVSTNLMWINVDIYQEIYAQYGVLPYCYVSAEKKVDWNTETKIITKQQSEALHTIIPQNYGEYDTLELYQLLAYACGKHNTNILDIHIRNSYNTSFFHDRVVHLSNCCYFSAARQQALRSLGRNALFQVKWHPTIYILFFWMLNDNTVSSYRKKEMKHILRLTYPDNAGVLDLEQLREKSIEFLLNQGLEIKTALKLLED